MKSSIAPPYYGRRPYPRTAAHQNLSHDPEDDVTQGNGNTQRYRIEELERKINELSNVKLEAAVLKRRVDEQDADVTEIKGELKSIRRGLWVAAATFASLAVGVFSLVLQGVR